MLQPEPTPTAEDPDQDPNTTPLPDLSDDVIALLEGMPDITAGPSTAVPIKPSNLSFLDWQLWDECMEKHDAYKQVQVEAAGLSKKMKPLKAKIASQKGTVQDRIDFCAMIDDLIDALKNLYALRKDYIDSRCDKFDWFNEGTQESDRRKWHEEELERVDWWIKNAYAVREQFCRGLF